MGTYRYKLPDIGEGVVEAEITAWHVSLGEQVEEDAPIADAMTDKATIELTAPVSGTISHMACEAGEMLAVGTDLVVFETSGPYEAQPAAEIDDGPWARIQPTYLAMIMIINLSRQAGRKPKRLRQRLRLKGFSRTGRAPEG